MIYIFLLIIGSIIFLEYNIYKRMINPFSVTALPYIIIIPLNNFVLNNYGYNRISDDTIEMITVGLVIMAIGTIATNRKLRIEQKKEVLNQEKSEDFSMYNYKAMLWFALVAEFLVILRVGFIVMSNGIRFFANDRNEGYLLTGLLGHVMLAYYPLIPMLFFYWLKHTKEKLYLISSALGVLLFFLTFVKYHSISLIIMIYIYVTVKDRKYLKSGTVFIVISTIILFVSNYLLTFIERGTLSRVSRTFYSNHIWNYVGGSVIRDNYLFEYGFRKNWTGVYKVGRMIFALPNMFLNRLFGIKLFSGLESDSGNMIVGNGERGTTFDFIGYMYPTSHSFEGYFWFVVTIFFIGYISAKLYNKSIRNYNGEKNLLSAIAFMTFFNFFWFFGVYGAQQPPWEIIVWSRVIPQLFANKKGNKNNRLRYRVRYKRRIY